MKMRMLATALVAAMTGVGALARAEADARDFRQIRSGEVASIRSDRAYLLLRIDTAVSHFSADVLRVPDAAEIAAYQVAKRAAHAKAGKRAGPIESFSFDYKGRANLYELASLKPFAKQGDQATVLAEVPPGRYIVYGHGIRGNLVQCLCLGTVGFDAKAGEVADLGTALFGRASKPSPHPELAGEVDLGPSAGTDYVLFAMALRPAGAGAGGAVPAGLDAARVKPARLHAVGPFVEPDTLLINRLAPIAGVLAYDGGRVIDVRTGVETKPN